MAPQRVINTTFICITFVVFVAKSKVHSACNAKASCTFVVDNNFFGRDPCHDTFKYADITYSCVVRNMNIILTGLHDNNTCGRA